jgi:hypothetical protein
MIIGLSGYAGSGKDTAGEYLQWLGEYPAAIDRTDGKNRSFNSFQMDIGMGYTPRWQIKKFADALRKVAHIFLPQFTLEFLYTNEFKEMELEGWEYETQQVELDEQGQDHTVMKTMTGRQFLQWLGTDAIRNGLHRDAWVKALMSEYQPLNYWKVKPYQEEPDSSKAYTAASKDPNWIITDMRFVNELRAVKAKGGYTIRIERLPEWVIKDEVDVEAWRNSLHESETALDNARFDFTVNNNGTMEELKAQIEQILTQITTNEQGRETKVHPVKKAG